MLVMDTDGIIIKVNKAFTKTSAIIQKTSKERALAFYFLKLISPKINQRLSSRKFLQAARQTTTIILRTRQDTCC